MSQDLSLHASRVGAVPFTEIYRETQARLLGRNVLVAASVFGAFVGWDLVVAPEHIETTLAIRVPALAFCAFLFVASGSARFRRFYNWYFIALLTVGALDAALVISVMPGGFTFGIAGVMICIVASSVLFSATAWATAAAGTLGTLGTVLLMSLHGEPEWLMRSAAILLFTAAGFAVLHSVQAERSALETHTALRGLEKEKQKTESLLANLTTMREERLTWLENLAGFLRHELKNQIVAVGTSIELAQDGNSLEANKIYLGRAQKGLGRMRSLVSSATEATSLEAALEADELEEVDLSTLVAERVLTFQQLHPDHQLVLRPKPGLMMHGNEERLSQLLDKLLTNAVEHSAEGSEIRVTLRRADDDWFEVCVENEGEPLPKNKERMFEAFVSSRSRSENLGLGLFVAQSIARNHRGHVLAEDLTDATGARFIVRLPSKPEAKTDELPPPKRRAKVKRRRKAVEGESEA